jgi:hypothetical protein
MGQKFFILLFLFCYFFVSIPESIGCTYCLGNSFTGGENFSFDPKIPNSAKGTLKFSQYKSSVQHGNAACHFCLYETAANPGGYFLPSLISFPETRQMLVSKLISPTFSIINPPENLL